MTKQIKFTIGSFKEYVKANRIASRNEEINAYGHALSYNRIWKSKKDYSRKKKHKKSFDGEDFDFVYKYSKW